MQHKAKQGNEMLSLKTDLRHLMSAAFGISFPIHPDTLFLLDFPASLKRDKVPWIVHWALRWLPVTTPTMEEISKEVLWDKIRQRTTDSLKLCIKPVEPRGQGLKLTYREKEHRVCSQCLHVHNVAKLNRQLSSTWPRGRSTVKWRLCSNGKGGSCLER